MIDYSAIPNWITLYCPDLNNAVASILYLILSFSQLGVSPYTEFSTVAFLVVPCYRNGNWIFTFNTYLVFYSTSKPGQQW